MKNILKSKAETYAILAPLLKRKTTNIFIIACFLTLFILCFIFPSKFEPGTLQEYLYIFATGLFADVEYTSKISVHPYVMSMAYSFSILAACMIGFMFSITKTDIDVKEKYLEFGIKERILLITISIIYILFPILHALPVDSVQRTYGFYQSVASHRTHIFLYTCGYMGVGFLMWVTVILEFSSIFARRK